MSVDRNDRIGLAHHVLDHQLVDSRGERCGKVDDLGLEIDGGRLHVAAVLAGPGALRERARARPLRWLFGLAGDECVVVAWRDVGDIVDHVALARPAPSLGLSRGEQHAAEIVARVLGPSAHAVRLGPTDVAQSPDGDDVELRLSHLLGRNVVDDDGRRLGRLRELRARKDGPLLSVAAGNAWRVSGLVLGWRGTADRLGVTAHERDEHVIDATGVEDWTSDPIRLRSVSRPA